VTFAGDMAANQSPGFKAIANKTRSLLHAACPSYKSCGHEPGCVLCRSGENGKPFRGDLCKKCSVSQISKSGRFIGEDSPEVAHKRMSLRELAKLQKAAQ
jgi:hypothetical protein